MSHRFNPRPRMGGDVPHNNSRIPGKCFNPRPRMGGDMKAKGTVFDFKGFNPRPRMGGDGKTGSAPDVGGRVSIHAPAWGATGIDRRSHTA